MQFRITRFLEWLDACQWGRLICFVIAPFLVVVSVYAWPGIAWLLVITAIADLVLLILYLKAYRPTNLALVVAIIPNTMGPLLASLYADKLLPNGEQLLQDGADVLVAIAFLFAGYLTLLLYLVARKVFNWPERFGIVLLVVIPFYMALGGTNFGTQALIDGPTLFSNVHAPAITALFLCRAIVAFIAALIAVVGDYETDISYSKVRPPIRESV